MLEPERVLLPLFSFTIDPSHHQKEKSNDSKSRRLCSLFLRSFVYLPRSEHASVLHFSLAISWQSPLFSVSYRARRLVGWCVDRFFHRLSLFVCLLLLLFLRCFRSWLPLSSSPLFSVVVWLDLFFFFFCQGNSALARREGCRSRKQRVSTARTPLFFFLSLERCQNGREKKKEANGREHISQASTREEVVVKEKEKEGAFPRVHHSFWCCSRREIAMVSVTVTGLYCFPVCACFFFLFQFVWVSVSLRQRVSLPFPTSSRTCFCFCCFSFVL